jgi:predicted ATPase/DNA-binding winged helix-turn-helix (wHTH) protein
MEVRCFSFGPFVLIPARQALLRKGTHVPLGTRALEVLSVLVQRPGAVVDKQELMSLVWTDTFVDDSNLKVQIAALRKTLDEKGSQPSCIATVIGRGYRFVDPVLDCALNVSIDSEGHLKSPPNHLKRLFGREEVVRRVASQVDECRLITLVGSAGVGKTAVACAAAEVLAPKYQHGTCFVDLSTLKDPHQVPQAVAKVLGINGEIDGIGERLLHHLRTKQMLMVLDTCESAIEAVAALVGRAHFFCPHVHILATSREILRTSGERVIRLPSLDCPHRGVSLTASEIRHSPSVQLFLDRAAETFADRELTNSEAEMIGRVCEELDGVPLAIELAARRVRALGFAGLPPVFTDDLFSLSYGERTGPPRHQSLGAALDWSLDPLPEHERHTLLRLASIEGSFDLDEGIATASDSATSRAETAACIANLVSKSLVERQGYGKVKFRLLNSMRRYAFRKLTPYPQQTVQRASGKGVIRYAPREFVREAHRSQLEYSDRLNVMNPEDNFVDTTATNRQSIAACNNDVTSSHFRH